MTPPTFDLGQIVATLTTKHPELANDIKRVEREYRKFLAQCRMHPEADIEPTPEVDILWHEHILATRQYAADCDAYFGHFLHHTPFLADMSATCSKQGAVTTCSKQGIKSTCIKQGQTLARAA